MSASDALSQLVRLVVILSAPALATVLVVGLLTGIFQTVTQIRERSISAVPKLLAAGAALALSASWMSGKILAFFHAVLEAVPLVGKS